MADIQMPQLGETVTEGTVTKWFKKVGEAVAEDEPLFEVSTDKVDSEVPSPAAGTLTEILVAEGETVDVGTLLARIGDAGAAPANGDGAAAQAAPVPMVEGAAGADAAPAPQAAAGSEAGEVPPPPPPPPPSGATPGVREPGQAPPPPAPAAPAPATTPVAEAAPAARSEALLLSPVVRRLIGEHGLDPTAITGTGPGGRITRADVQAVIEAGANGTTPATRAAPASADRGSQPARPSGPAPKRAGARDEVLPHSNIRRRTAEHMVRSKHTSAHVYASIEVDFAAVDAARATHRGQWKADEGFSLTYLPFVSRAVVDAIREFPEVNSTFGDDELVVHHDVNLGIAVDLDFAGLMAPVVQGADAKRLRAIARDISDLASRARGRKLSPDDISGGTFTITNPGPFGTTMTMPIINQPQVAILATDAVRRRPVVVATADGGEAIAIHPTGNLTLAWDHRAFDGAYAASFLALVKEIIETRDWEAELA